ncbi:MAG: HIT domain-containing protein [Caldilineaceae bacterium]
MTNHGATHKRYSLGRLLFRIARSRVGALMIGWSFAYMHAWIPVDRLYETELVMAFYHPQPQHKVHILIVPKRQLRTLLMVTEADMPVIHHVITTAQHLVKELALEAKGFRLIVNGGEYQDVLQIHWHLISDE